MSALRFALLVGAVTAMTQGDVSAGSSSATLSVSVTVLPSCTVAANAQARTVTMACARQAVSQVSLSVPGREARVHQVTPGATVLPFGGSANSSSPAPLLVQVDF